MNTYTIHPEVKEAIEKATGTHSEFYVNLYQAISDKACLDGNTKEECHKMGMMAIDTASKMIHN